MDREEIGLIIGIVIGGILILAILMYFAYRYHQMVKHTVSHSYNDIIQTETSSSQRVNRTLLRGKESSSTKKVTTNTVKADLKNKKQRSHMAHDDDEEMIVFEKSVFQQEYHNTMLLHHNSGKEGDEDEENLVIGRGGGGGSSEGPEKEKTKILHPFEDPHYRSMDLGDDVGIARN